jgi:hypothetical protein
VNAIHALALGRGIVTTTVLRAGAFDPQTELGLGLTARYTPPAPIVLSWLEAKVFRESAKRSLQSNGPFGRLRDAKPLIFLHEGTPVGNRTLGASSSGVSPSIGRVCVIRRLFGPGWLVSSRYGGLEEVDCLSTRANGSRSWNERWHVPPPMFAGSRAAPLRK